MYQTHDIFILLLLLVIIIVKLLKVSNAVELHFLKSLKINYSIQLALYPWDSFWTNNRNMADNSVEKCFVMLNVKLAVELKFKTFFWL